MSIFKCKMCGGALEIMNGETVATCEYCGTQQTLPRLDDDRRANLYDRANHFRRNNDFDKAMGIYEQILNEDSSDAEAYWSLVLCRYGIEYVEDPASGRRVPTVNRAQYTSIFDDDNYKSALQHADTLQRGIYEAEARGINEIQKGILAISQKEESFDVFICYKESDSNGRRTPDSVLANDLYHQLTQEGFKVFFSRITLEDKLGSAYEPYIFAALNSAKVMVVLGTKPEYFSAVWVKNEWSRYLALIRQGQKKMLIPAYKDMDPYDLPEEFSHLQAQDMSKLGFMQDLIRGIKKITQTGEAKPAVVKETIVKEAAATSRSHVQALLDRGSMALEDGEWDKADGFFEDVLNSDAKNARAYLGKTLAQEKCATLEAFIWKRENAAFSVTGQMLSLEPDTDYINARVLQFSLPDYVEEDAILALYDCDLSYHSDVAERRQQYQNEERYWADHRQLSRAERFAEGELAEELTREKKALFAELSDRVKKAEADEAAAIKRVQENYVRFVRQADAQAEALYRQGVERKEADYQNLLQIANTSCDVGTLMQTAEALAYFADYRNGEAIIEHCRRRAAEEQAKLDAQAEADRIAAEEARRIQRAKNRKIAMIVTPLLALAVAAYFLRTLVVIPNAKYNAAVELMDAGQYEEAIAAFEAMDGYKDSEDKIPECNYLFAVALMDAEQYEEAIARFEATDGYKDSAESIEACKSGMLNNPVVGKSVYFGSYEQDNDTSNGAEEIEWIVLDIQDGKALLLSKNGLDYKQFSENEPATWETCTLRTWLNNAFINKAFSEEEQKKIPMTTVFYVKDYSGHYIMYGEERYKQDQVFLLGSLDFLDYIHLDAVCQDAVCQCEPTAYTAAQSGGHDAWWLRTTTFDDEYAGIVFRDEDEYFGYDYGQAPVVHTRVVRPAIWVEIGS